MSDLIETTRCIEQMDFPQKTFDEFAKYYGFKDKKEVYTNGSELIPVFRVKQWLEHISTTKNDLGVDCIDRNKAYEIIESWAQDFDSGTYFDNEQVKEIIMVCANRIDELPTITSQRWIPVEEKLPSDCNKDWVLAQIQEDNGYLWIPCVAEYRKAKDDWFSDANDVGWLKDHNGAFKVVAWMPLPKQYRGAQG